MSNIKKILILAFAFLPGFALADSEPTVEPVKTEAVITVKPEENKLELTKLLAVSLPEVKPEVKKQAPPAPKPPEPVVHEVQSGDTLTAIGDSHQTPWTRVYDANADVQDPNMIVPGEKLRIPRPDENLASRPLPENAPPVPEPVAPVAQTQSSVSYTVTQTTVTHTTAELIGKYGYALAGGNCVNTAKAYGKNQPGNPINWVATTQTPFIGAAALFSFNHVAVVVGIHSNGDLEVAHENCPGCPSRYPRSAFRGFF